MRGSFTETYDEEECMIEWTSTDGCVDRVEFSVIPIRNPNGFFDIEKWERQIRDDILMDLDPEDLL
jgi:hypothetical protein